MVIDGKQIAEEMLQAIRAEVAALPFTPVFCDVVVGEDPVSLSYVSIKGRTAQRVGMEFLMEKVPGGTSEEALAGRVRELSARERMCGLIVQLPLPPHMDRRTVLDAIAPALDVDCIGKANSDSFYRGAPVFVPPTAAAVLELLDRSVPDPDSKTYAVIGQGELVGKPVAHLLRQRGRNVLTADRSTRDLDSVTARADVVISATGSPGLLRGPMVADGAVVIDAGTAESEGGITGDVDFASVSRKAAAVSPVPGGVGPVTVAMLLRNVLAAAKRKV